jgi:hypothetical protein
VSIDAEVSRFGVRVRERQDVSPLWDEAEFTCLINDMVVAEAPRVFALVQVCGDRVDARIAAWGLSWGDRAEVIGVDRGLRLSLGSPERARRVLSRIAGIPARIVWLGAR